MVRKKTLRLFQKLLRLFQPERYGYCSPLLAIGRKPEKRCGDKPPMVPRRPLRPCRWTARRVEGAKLALCTLTVDPVPDCKPPGVRSIERRLAWIHNRDAPAYPPVYIIIIGGCSVLCCVQAQRWYLVSVEALRLLACPPAPCRMYSIAGCAAG